MWSTEQDVGDCSSGTSRGLIGAGQYPALAAECKSPGVFFASRRPRNAVIRRFGLVIGAWVHAGAARGQRDC